MGSPFNPPPPPRWTGATQFPSLSVTQPARLFLNWVSQHSLPHLSLSLYLIFIPDCIISISLFYNVRIYWLIDWLIPFIFIHISLFPWLSKVLMLYDLTHAITQSIWIWYSWQSKYTGKTRCSCRCCWVLATWRTRYISCHRILFLVKCIFYFLLK